MADKSLSLAEKNATQVQYEVMGESVTLDPNFIKSYLVRGKSELVTMQEVVLFMNTCKMQKLNPMANGEVYLIKYDEKRPAQIVVGKDAYTKRAYLNPNYICKKDGIVVLRGNEIVKKEGCCVYPGEKLIGGWCKINYMRMNAEREAYREVALDEYNAGQSNWNSKPATMINKVAISQCIRDAFPTEFEGLYTEDEMIASGAIDVTPPEEKAYMAESTEEIVPMPERTVTQDEKKALFKLAQGAYGKEGGNNFVMNFLKSIGLESTDGLKKGDYDKLMDTINEDLSKQAEDAEKEDGE